jgi:hypothetical protein
MLEANASIDRLRAHGADDETARDIVGRIRASEYKRRQLPPGIKVSPKAFGFGRRHPLTNGYRG